jgi:hypothetical protein
MKLGAVFDNQGWEKARMPLDLLSEHGVPGVGS